MYADYIKNYDQELGMKHKTEIEGIKGGLSYGRVYRITRVEFKCLEVKQSIGNFT